MTTDTHPSEDTIPDLAPLLTSMRKGDPASCREFVASLQASLYHYLYWLSGDPETAVDLFQQTMMAVYRNLGRVRKTRSAREWVFRQATQRYLDQTRRQVQQKRSSWDKILKSGLDRGADKKWSQWDDSPPDESDPEDRTVYLVDAVKHLEPRQRAGILLAATSGLSASEVVACLHLSRRSARRTLLAAFAQLAPSLQNAPAPQSPAVPKTIRERIRLQLLGLLSPGRGRRLVALIEGNTELQALQAIDAATWNAICALPVVAPPATLLDDTEAHLRAGQEAKEVRIANWGFRFMQVTVPIFILIFIAIILLPAIGRSREAARIAAGSENLQAIGKALLAYSNQSSGNTLPAMVSVDGLRVPDLSQLYPRYLQDPALLVRPSLNDPALLAEMTKALQQSPPDYDTAHHLLARSYVYTGYVILTESDLNTFIELCRVTPNLDFNARIETAAKDYYRLSRGVEVFFTTNYGDHEATAKTRASIPIMFETFPASGFGRDPDGANVLYLDGHVDYVRFGSTFPITSAVREILDADR